MIYPGRLIHSGRCCSARIGFMCRQPLFAFSLPALAWFKDVLSRIPNHSITRLAELLPHNWASTQP